MNDYRMVMFVVNNFYWVLIPCGEMIARPYNYWNRPMAQIWVSKHACNPMLHVHYVDMVAISVPMKGAKILRYSIPIFIQYFFAGKVLV